MGTSMSGEGRGSDSPYVPDYADDDGGDPLPAPAAHVSVNARPASALATDISMRTQSFLFIAIAALVCDARSARHGGNRVELRVPENGFMSINAPLTPRRIGSLSTRTTHPWFLGEAQIAVVNAGAQFWMDALEWGKAKRLLTPTETGILGVAARVPSRTPTDKQSSKAIEILGKLNGEGYSEELPASS